MRSTNRIGWLPLHLAAILDVLFYLLCEFPDSVMQHADFQAVLQVKRQRIS